MLRNVHYENDREPSRVTFEFVGPDAEVGCSRVQTRFCGHEFVESLEVVIHDEPKVITLTMEYDNAMTWSVIDAVRIERSRRPVEEFQPLPQYL